MGESGEKEGYESASEVREDGIRGLALEAFVDEEPYEGGDHAAYDRGAGALVGHEAGYEAGHEGGGGGLGAGIAALGKQGARERQGGIGESDLVVLKIGEDVFELTELAEVGAGFAHTGERGGGIVGGVGVV